jgi:hypothetical protein
MNATSIEPARPASEHLVSLSHHSYLIRSVSGSDELALFDMFFLTGRPSPALPRHDQGFSSSRGCSPGAL